MLVQLDTGDIANLERLSLREPTALQVFAGEWNARGLALALNLHHAQEIAQQDSLESRGRRVALIKLFDDVRFSGMAEFGVMKNEAAVLIDAVGNGEPANFSELRNHFFARSSGDDFEEYVLENLSELREMRVPIDQTIAADNALPKLGTRRLLKNVELTPESGALAERRFRDTLDRSELPINQKEWLARFFERIAGSFFGQPNQRAGLERHYRLEGIAWVAACTDSDLVLAAGFADTVRELLEEARGNFPPEPSEEELLNRVDPYSAPGTRIQFALHRAQRTAGRLEAAHETDRSHAVFAPYVDFAFVDRQTASFLGQELKRSPDLLHASDLTTVNPSGAVDQIINRVVATRVSTKQK